MITEERNDLTSFFLVQNSFYIQNEEQVKFWVFHIFHNFWIKRLSAWIIIPKLKQEQNIVETLFWYQNIFYFQKGDLIKY